MRWLIVGTGPNVVDQIRRVDLAGKVTLTSNAGLRLLSSPDYYVAIDMVASVRHASEARDAQRHGTKLVTLRRNREIMKARQVHFYDEVVSEESQLPFRFTGSWVVEFALRHGATSLELIGYDGYPRQGPLYFAGITGEDDIPPDKRTRTIADELQRRACMYPDVPIVQHGPTEYQIDAANWTVI